MTDRPVLKVTRDQLRAFIGDDFRTIKQFENLFFEVNNIEGDYLPITGGTLTGQLVIDYGFDNDPGLIINVQGQSGDFARYVNVDGEQVGIIGTDDNNGIAINYGDVFLLREGSLVVNNAENEFNVSFNKQQSDPGIWFNYISSVDSLEFDTNQTTLNSPSDGAQLSNQPTGSNDLAIATVKYVNDNDFWQRNGTLLTPETLGDDVEWNFINYVDATTGQTNSYRIGSNALGSQDTYLYGRNIGTESITNSVIIGEESFDSATSGNAIYAIGESMAPNYSGSGQLILMGASAGNDLTSGSNLTLIGSQAGTNITSGSNCIGIGNNVFFESLTPNSCVAIGDSALRDVNGFGAVGLGVDAGRIAGLGQTNDYSVNLGYRAGSFSYGDSCVYLGRDAGYNSGTQDNRLYIANNQTTTLIYGEFDTRTLIIDNDTNLAQLTSHPDGAVPLAISTVQYVDDNTFWSRTGTLLNPKTSTDDVEWDAFKYLVASTGGDDCIFIGPGSGAVNTGDDNTGIGANTLGANTTGARSIAIGADSLKSNTTGVNNTGIGRQTLEFNIGGQSNSAIGFQTLQNNISGNFNLGIGHQVLKNATTASNNVAIGYLSMFNTVSGGSNTSIGYEAMLNNVSGVSNVAVGREALEDCLSNSNTAVGYQAARNLTTASNNVALGRNALNNCVTGNLNVCLGYQAGFFETGGQKLYIANSNTTTPLIYGEFNNEILTFNCVADGATLTNQPTGADPLAIATVDYADSNIEDSKRYALLVS